MAEKPHGNTGNINTHRGGIMKTNALAETIYALITCALVILFTLMLIDGWSSDICQQREAWEATGHDYVGIPPGAENCAINGPE